MSQRERQLMAAMAKAADGQERSEVIGAAGNIILNVLRQDHSRKAEAEERLESLFADMRQSLGRDHYDSSGQRRAGRIVIPPLGALIDG